MAVVKGQYAKVTITVDATPVDVLKLREWSISTSSEKIDATAAGDKWEKHEIGLLSWEGEATCVDADTFWLAMLDEKVTIKFYDKADDVSPKFTGTASMDVERSVPYDDLIETSISFTGDGELV
jgi:hypothetical protein